MDTLVAHFKRNGISALHSATEQQLSHLLQQANHAYHNTSTPIFTDTEYDILEEYVTRTYTSSSIGAPPLRNKTPLPYPMPSMDKIKPDTDALTHWISSWKGPYVVSCKLDGVSGLYTLPAKGQPPQLYTRGDGQIGQNISHLLPHLHLPLLEYPLTIRGEFILTKHDFHTHYRTTYSNARNMVAGIINHKTLQPSVQHLHFVAYEVLYPPHLTPSQQMTLLSSLNIETVEYLHLPTVSNDGLSDCLLHWRQHCPYDIDGVIVAKDTVYERTISNPSHAVAFKMVLSEQRAETTVVDVLWTPSKDGYLKPRVQLEPVQIGGVRIEFATGFNAAFIEENRIGVGAVVDLVRSGDVIPYIKNVIQPCEGGGKMPDVPFQWNATHVDILLVNKETDYTVREKNITGFFKGIGVDGLSSGNITRIIDAGFDSILKIIQMTKTDFLSIPGFQEKMSEKLYTGIREKLETATLTQLLVASNLLGRGISEKKLALVLQSYPDVFLSNSTPEEKINKITEIKGMAQTTAVLIVQNIPRIIAFLTEIGLSSKLHTSTSYSPNITHPLSGKSIVFSGFRDAHLQKKLESCGAKITGTVTKNTFLLLVQNMEENTEKKKTALKFNIPIITPSSLNL